MNCKDVKRALFDFVDGELSETTEKPFREHVELCESCRRAVQFEAQFKARVAQSLAPQTMPAAFAHKINQRLLEENARPPGVLSRLSASPALSFALAACLSFFIALSIFRPSEPSLTPVQIIQSLHLPDDARSHLLACKGCQNEITAFALVHENGEDNPRPHANYFKNALLHLQKCSPCREHAIDILRAHAHGET